MNIIEALVELANVLVDALTDALQAADLERRLREWHYVVTHPGVAQASVLSDRQITILELARAKGYITNGDVRKICFWHSETIRLDLVALVDAGLLMRNGRGKGTYYMLSDLVSGDPE